MLTLQNYFDTVKDVDFTKMPEAIRQGHAFVAEMTDNGNSWADYYESDGIKETVDIYIFRQ